MMVRRKLITGFATFALLAACGRTDRIVAPDGSSLSPQGARPEAAVAFAPMIANLTGPVPSPAGLRACFAAESNGNDVVNGNIGALSGGTSYSAGRFGQAFDFQALGQGVFVPASASLNIGTAPGLTMAAWVYPRNTMFQASATITGAGPIVEFDQGAHLWHHNQQNAPTGIFSNLAEGLAPSQWHIVQVPHHMPFNGWHHAVVTYSKASGQMKLYVNGVMVADSARGVFSANTTTTFRIGSRVSAIIGPSDYTFNGLIDEVQLYDRELSQAEVNQLVNATGTMCVAPPAAFQVTQLPVGSGESGVPFTTQPVVAILDESGNVVLNATNAVTATVVSGTGTLLGTTTVNAVNGIATFTNLALAGAATTTIGFSAGALPPAVGSPTTSTPLATVQVARQLGIVTQPGGSPSGTPLAPQPVLQIRDAAGLLVPGTTNAVTASVATGAGTLSGTTTVSAVNGTATFTNLAITGGGPITLAFASGALTGATSASFNVTASPATQLSMLTEPAGAESGLPFTTQPVIEVKDGTGARAIFATGTVTAQIFSGTGGTLVGTVTAPIVNGLATFGNLQINGPGTFTLRFTSGSLAPAVATPISVIQQVRNLAIIAGPSLITNGVPMVPPFQIELRDAANIRVATSTFLTRISLVLGTGTLTGTREVNAVNGIVTYTDVILNDGSAQVGFNFWVVDPAAGTIPAYTLTGLINVQANNTGGTYTWGGFFQPVDNLPKINKIEGGSTVPVKFSIGGDFGPNIFAAGYPASQPASCATFLPTGPLVPIATGAQILSDLKYNDKKYHVNWKTDKAWDGTCRILVLRFTDGLERSAHFTIK